MGKKSAGLLVLDTNIIAYFFLHSPFAAEAERLQALAFEWVAPRLWRSEFLNVLALHMRHNGLPLDKAKTIFALADEMLREGERHISASSILTLVDQSSCSAYDCEFIALAQKLSTKLVTQDKKLLRDFPHVAVSLKEALKLREGMG